MIQFAKIQFRLKFSGTHLLHKAINICTWTNDLFIFKLKTTFFSYLNNFNNFILKNMVAGYEMDLSLASTFSCNNICKFLFVIFTNVSHFDGNWLKWDVNQGAKKQNWGEFLFVCLFQQWGSAKWLNIHELMTELFNCESNLQVQQLGWSILKFSAGKTAFI